MILVRIILWRHYMVNTEKIRLMSRAAAYESTRLQEDSFARRFYKQDYVAYRALGLRVWATIFYVIYWVYKLVKIFYLESANLLYYDYRSLFIQFILYYLILLVVVSVLAYIVHGIRFDKARKRIDAYYDLLDRIEDYNQIETKK